MMLLNDCPFYGNVSFRKIKKPPLCYQHKDGSYLRRDTRFALNIVSSSEQAHNQNICVAVIFVPNFKKEGDIMGELRTKKRGKSWEYSFECARVDGKRKSISKGGFRTKADAIAAGTKAKAE